MSYTHYIGATTDAAQLFKFGQWGACKVIQLAKGKYPILVYRGMSGISLATAIRMHLHRKGVPSGAAYVRKESEDSHGEPVETFDIFRTSNRIFIFVDDFVQDGGTFTACCNAIAEENFLTYTEALKMPMILAASGTSFRRDQQHTWER